MYGLSGLEPPKSAEQAERDSRRGFRIALAVCATLLFMCALCTLPLAAYLAHR